MAPPASSPIAKRGFAFLQLCLLLLNVCVSSAIGFDPNVVQVDVVFPRDRSSYKPVYPFPVVLAVHNVRLAWPYTSFITWELASWPESEILGRGGVIRQADYPINATEVPDDRWLMIEGAPDIINTTATVVQLRVAFIIGYACDKTGFIPSNQSFDIGFRGGVTFNLSESGELPDVGKKGLCPDLVGAIVVEGEGRDWRGKRCPILGDIREQPHPVETCALTLNNDDLSLVTAKMLETASCTAGSWPDPTGLVRACPTDPDTTDSSGHQNRLSRGAAFGVMFLLLAWTTWT